MCSKMYIYREIKLSGVQKHGQICASYQVCSDLAVQHLLDFTAPESFWFETSL